MSIEEDYDEEAAALYRKWVGRVQGFLIGMGCDHGLAEEIADDAFLGARRHWCRVRTYDGPEGYFSRLPGTSAADDRRSTTTVRKVFILIRLERSGMSTMTLLRK